MFTRAFRLKFKPGGFELVEIQIGEVLIQKRLGVGAQFRDAAGDSGLAPCRTYIGR